MNKNDPSKSELILWLHIIESSAPRRFAGLLTELYFSRQLKASDKYKDVADGWAYITRERGSSPRFWFKIFPNQPKLSSAEEHFVSSLASLGHRFFSLSLTVSAIGMQRLPDLELKVKEFTSASNGGNLTYTRGAANAQIKITKRLEEYLKGQVHSRLNGSVGGNLPFQRWLENLEVPELLALFSQRCFMNCRKPSPLDLDAVAVTYDGRVAFVEFKRKYPTIGASKPINAKNLPIEFMDIAYEIEKKLRSADPGNFHNAMKLFNVACNELDFKYVREQSFGLDMAHFETLQLCSETEIIYDYHIWNSANEMGKGAFKISDVINDLESTLTYELIKKKEITWWNRTLRPTDATGLTFTWGENSGAYDNRCRVQITFDATSIN